MGKRKDLKTYREDSCNSCKEQGWPNKKKGRTCCLSYPTKVTNYRRNKITINSEKDLYALYEEDSQDQADVWREKTGRKDIKQDSLYEWVIKRGVCPYGIISANSKYWLELISMYDGEMGLSTPLDYDRLPAIFFEVLRIHRDSKPEIETPKVKDAK